MELVCRLLEVSRSGYYEWLGRKPSLRRQQDPGTETPAEPEPAALSALRLDSLYHLIRPQLSCSRKRIPPPDERDEHLLHAGVPTSHDQLKTRTPSRPNLLARRFSFDKPRHRMGRRITYIPPARAGSALLEDFLCTEADRPTPSPTASSQISLSPPSRYGRPAPQALCPASSSTPTAASIRRLRLPSASRQSRHPAKHVPQDDPYDNAVTKTSSAASKCEVRPSAPFRLKEGTSHGVRRLRLYRDFYNPVRPHSSIGWRPPDAFARCLV